MSVENVTADVMTSSPGSQAEQLDREVQRRRARVAHDAAALAEQLGDALLERLARSCRCAARRGPPRSTSTTASISSSSWTLPA